MTKNLQYFTSKDLLFNLRARHPVTKKWAYFESMDLKEAMRLNPILIEWEYVE